MEFHCGLHISQKNPSASQKNGFQYLILYQLGNPATHHCWAGGFASQSFERFAFFTTSFVIGTEAEKL